MEGAAATGVTHRGGCHCGRVRFAFDAAAELTVLECDCSLCRMTGFQHVVVGASQFRLERGADALREYRFNTGVARHLFCETCGIKAFYVPRSDPDGYSIDLRCVDAGTVTAVRRLRFDDATRTAEASYR
jgi:hypothetical protein